VKLAIFNFY